MPGQGDRASRSLLLACRQARHAQAPGELSGRPGPGQRVDQAHGIDARTRQRAPEKAAQTPQVTHLETHSSPAPLHAALCPVKGTRCFSPQARAPPTPPAPAASSGPHIWGDG